MAYNAEEIRDRLLKGEPLSFSADQPEEERQIPADSIAEAARAAKRVEVENAVVTGPLDLSYAEVRERFVLENVELRDPVDFSFAHFRCGIACQRVRFTRAAKFQGAVFDKHASFRRAEFAEGASFHGIEVGGLANFNGARFGGEVRFDQAKITGSLFFRPEEKHRAEFEGEAGVSRHRGRRAGKLQRGALWGQGAL